MPQFTRRKMILAGSAGLLGSFALGARPAAASTSGTVTMWKLNPAWGTPLPTTTGATRTRCKGTACHKAASHRFFLTEADAIAGRLHKCCLAQPTPVELCIDLNALMPYYAARLGGVDGRCPTLPEPLRFALYDASCALNLTTSQPIGSEPTEAQPTASLPQNGLPVTGASIEKVLAAGAIIGTAGVILTASQRTKTAEATQAN